MAEDVTLLPTVRSPCLRPGILKFGKMHCTRQRVWFEEIDPPNDERIHPKYSILDTILNCLSLEEDLKQDEGYEMKILCCKLSAFWLSVASGGVCMVFLVAAAIRNLNTCSSLLQTILWTIISIITIYLFIGLWKKKSSFLTPFLVVCLLIRLFCLTGSAVTVVATILTAFYLSIQNLVIGSKTTSDVEILRVFVVLATMFALLFFAVNLPFLAVRRCRSIMKQADK